MGTALVGGGLAHPVFIAHRLGTVPVAVGTLHVLLAVGRAVHQELQEPVHRRQPCAPPHHRGVPVGTGWDEDRNSTE